MRKLFFFMALFATLATYADDKTVSSPDGRLQVTISCQDGRACYSVSYDGNRTLMRSMKNGEAGGVLCSLIDYRRYLIELVAYQDAEMIMFSADAVFQTEGTIVVPQHKILVNIIQSQREMYLDMAEHLAILSQRTVRTKILRFLRYYSEMNNSLEFKVPYTREGLADYLAVDRASLSRSLGAMRDEGVIEFDRGSFKVLEEDKLYDN